MTGDFRAYALGALVLLAWFLLFLFVCVALEGGDPMYKNRSRIKRTIWITRYNARDCVTGKRVSGYVVGRYLADAVERALNREERRFFVEDVEHEAHPRSMTVEKFYENSEEEG